MNNLVGWPQPAVWPLTGFGGGSVSAPGCVTATDTAIAYAAATDAAIASVASTDEGCDDDV